MIVMKTMKKPSLVLLAALAALSGNSLLAQRSLTSTPISEDFAGYAGSAVSLPANFIAEATAPGTIYFGNSDGSGIPLSSGFYNFTNGSDNSFGILEGDQGSGDIADTRLLLNFQNNTGSTITRLRVRYKVEQWRDGARLNSITLKYNTVNSGFSSQPALVTTNAKVNAGGDVAYDGADPTYYTQVDTEFDLPSSLANGNSAYLRWQYSTASGSGRRDGLGIADIEVSVATAGTPKNWVGGTGAWNATGGTDWSGAAWDNAGNYNAVFGGTAGTVTIGSNVTAVNLVFNTTGYTVARTSSFGLTLKGRIDTATGVTATVSAPIAGVSGLSKTGPGILELSGASTYTGVTSISDGTLKLLANNALPSGSVVQLGATGKLDLNAYDLTVAGLQGDAAGEVAIPSGKILTLTTTGDQSYKGKITGAGGVVKNGSAAQRFRNQAKTYTGPTDVDAGRLEITENGIPTGTSSFSLDGSSTEVLLSSDTANVTYRFGPASPASTVFITGNAQFATDTDVTASVTNTIDIGTGGGIITARGTSGSLTLNGAISGSGALTRKGQAPLVLNASSTSYSGSVLLENGLTTINSGKTFGNGSNTITVQGDNSSEKAGLRGAGTIAGSVTYGSNSLVDLLQLSGTTVITGNLNLGSATVDSSGVPSGTYNLFNVSGTVGSFSGVTIVGGGTLSNTSGLVSLTK
jgi:autotransporter-associated beta strand protein